jgi:hypothetical protein
MTCNFFPHTIPADTSIGAEDSLGAVFAADCSLISVRLGRGVAIIDTDLEIADLSAVHFIVGAVFISANIDSFVVHVPPLKPPLVQLSA